MAWDSLLRPSKEFFEVVAARGEYLSDKTVWARSCHGCLTVLLFPRLSCFSHFFLLLVTSRSLCAWPDAEGQDALEHRPQSLLASGCRVANGRRWAFFVSHGLRGFSLDDRTLYMSRYYNFAVSCYFASDKCLDVLGSALTAEYPGSPHRIVFRITTSA